MFGEISELQTIEIPSKALWSIGEVTASHTVVTRPCHVLI